MSLYRSAVRPLLFRVDAELAHKLVIGALARLPVKSPPLKRPTTVAGLTFPNPIGLAAGFDKGAEAVGGAFRLGFGFVEIGTVTPKPQPGNPRPRLFRLVDDEAVINRFGFNSEGHAVVHHRLSQVDRSKCGIIGVNLGANKESEDQAGDYTFGIAAFADVADYFTINISSPNTPGLRDLQGPKRLETLLERAREARSKASVHRPLFLKVAPDLSEEDIDGISQALNRHPMDALIVSNTTIGRKDIEHHPLAKEAGGLSGRPLAALSTATLQAFHQRLGPDLPLIGVGGISSAEDIRLKFDAGASLVQLYSALVYKGPGLVRSLLNTL